MTLAKVALALLFFLAALAPVCSAITTRGPTTRGPTTGGPTTHAPTSKTPTTRAPTSSPTLGTNFPSGQACASFDLMTDVPGPVNSSEFGYTLAVSYDGNTVVTSTLKTSYVTSEGETTVTIPSHGVLVYARSSYGVPHVLFQDLLSLELQDIVTLALTPAADTLAVGNATGGIQIFTRPSNTSLFVLSQTLEFSEVLGGTLASVAFSPSGKILAIGSGALDQTPVVIVMERSGLNVNFTQIAPAVSTLKGNGFGSALALTEDVLVASEPAGPGYGAGQVRILSRNSNGSSWDWFGPPILPSGDSTDYFGQRVDMSYDGLTLAFSSGLNAAYVCDRPSQSRLCTQLQVLNSSEVTLVTPSVKDFGAVVALDASGSTLVVAAPFDNNYAGGFQHYRNAGLGQGFVPVGTLYTHCVDSPTDEPLFGIGLKISGDGRTVVSTALMLAGSDGPYFTVYTCSS